MYEYMKMGEEKHYDGAGTHDAYSLTISLDVRRMLPVALQVTISITFFSVKQMSGIRAAIAELPSIQKHLQCPL